MSDEPNMPSTTEEAAATPGWVEGELDGILADLPSRPTLARLRVGYLDCLAGIGGAGEIGDAQARCRRRFLEGLQQDGIADETRDALDRRLAALEAEIADRI